MKNIFRRILAWYDRNSHLYIRAATILFVLQLIHLIWMTTNVLAFRLWGVSLFPKELEPILALIDYTEIPALIGVTLIYVADIVGGYKTRKAWWYIILLNTQWIHLFWITDEIILQNFTGQILIKIPVWLSWIAIMIDYLELPVMYDTLKRSFGKKKEV